MNDIFYNKIKYLYLHDKIIFATIGASMNHFALLGTVRWPAYSHPSLFPIADFAVEIASPPRLLVADRHQAERVGGVA
jgi:hypothetical protein